MPLNLPLRCSNCGKDVSDGDWTNYADLMVACPTCLSAAATARPDPHPLIAYIRGLCSDEEPYELIDAKLAELDELFRESQ
jgi:hypothetical protein